MGSVPGGQRERSSTKGRGVSGGTRPGWARNWARGSSAAWPCGRSRSSKICLATLSMDSGKVASSRKPGGVVEAWTGSQSVHREFTGRTQYSLPSKFCRNSCGSFESAWISVLTVVPRGHTARRRSNEIGWSAGDFILTRAQMSLLDFASPPSLAFRRLSASATARFQSASAVLLSRQWRSWARRCSSVSRPPSLHPAPPPPTSASSLASARPRSSERSALSRPSSSARARARRSRSSIQAFQTFWAWA
mmetsp:Transcript_37302/g.93675  ORF Transcript_37302/g.93675 Transcript_37302/m.93675 type:complete len:249 (+) Transcript_37302:429-1175(+)